MVERFGADAGEGPAARTPDPAAAPGADLLRPGVVPAQADPAAPRRAVAGAAGSIPEGDVPAAAPPGCAGHLRFHAAQGPADHDRGGGAGAPAVPVPSALLGLVSCRGDPWWRKRCRPDRASITRQPIHGNSEGHPLPWQGGGAPTRLRS